MKNLRNTLVAFALAAAPALAAQEPAPTAATTPEAAPATAHAGTDAALVGSTAATAPVLDLNLDRAIEIALAENPTIRVADTDVALKQVADTEAWQNLLPSVSGQLALSHNIQVAAIKTQMGEFKMGMDGSTTATGALTLNLPLFAPAIYQNMKLTKEDIALAREKARGSRLDLIKQVTKAYYGALVAKDSYEVVQRSTEVARESFELISSMYEVGRVSEYDKISAEVQYRSMNSALISTESAVTLSLLQLKVLMGVTENVTLNISDNLANYRDSLHPYDPSAAALDLSNNTSLRQLDMNIALVERAGKLLKTNFMPTIAFQANYQYQSYSNPDWNVFKYHYSPSSTVNFVVSIPIYTASNWTKLKSNRLQLSQLHDTRDYTLSQLSMAVESYARNMQSSIAQVESNTIAVEQARKAQAIASKRYEIGNGTILELNQAETALTQAELTYNQSIYDYLSNRADLDYTLGGGTNN